MLRLKLWACLAAALLIAAPAAAQTTTKISGGRSAQGVFSGDLTVPVNKSQIVEIDRVYRRISVGNSEIADVLPLTDRTLYVLGKKLGTTNITIIGSNNRPIAVVNVTVGQDIEGIKTRLNEIFPGEKVEVRAAADRVILTGQVSSPLVAQKAALLAESFAPNLVVNMMSVKGSQQVMLAVRFAEVNRSVGRELSLRSNVITTGDFSFLSFAPGALGGLLGESFGVGQLTRTPGDATIDTLINALETKGAARSLAAPNLIAMSGETANFLAGGEFPVPVAQSSAAGAGGLSTGITVEFKQFGVALSFTPTVIDANTINLVVKPEVSSLDRASGVEVAGFTIPALSTRRVETTIELRDGQSFAIAGLFQNNFGNNVSQLPWIGDVPVLGALFRSTSFQRNETELVVIVTPYLVKPASLQTLATSYDKFVEPTDFDRVFGGRVEGSAIPLLTQPGTPAAATAASAAPGAGASQGHIIP